MTDDEFFKALKAFRMEGRIYGRMSIISNTDFWFARAKRDHDWMMTDLNNCDDEQKQTLRGAFNEGFAEGFDV